MECSSGQQKASKDPSRPTFRFACDLRSPLGGAPWPKHTINVDSTRVPQGLDQSRNTHDRSAKEQSVACSNQKQRTTSKIKPVEIRQSSTGLISGNKQNKVAVALRDAPNLESPMRRRQVAQKKGWNCKSPNQPRLSLAEALTTRT